MSGLRSRLRPLAKFTVAFGGSAVVAYAWRRQLDAVDETALNPHAFIPFRLTGKEPTSSTAAILKLQYEDPNVVRARSLIEEAQEKGVWSVQIKQPQLQIARSYTPLPGDTTESDCEAAKENTVKFNLLVRREHGGEVSNYLHGLPAHSTIEIRGPFIEYTLPTSTKRILFLAGGTGIAPAAQLAASLEARTDTEMSILWANRREEDCLGGARSGQPLEDTLWSRWISLTHKASSAANAAEHSEAPNKVVQMLRSLEERTSGRVRVDYFVDEHQRYITTANVRSSLQRLAENRGLQGKSEEKRIILVSGPPGFVQYWAGAKVWDAQGESQGPLKGELSKMRLDGWQVWKL